MSDLLRTGYQRNTVRLMNGHIEGIAESHGLRSWLLGRHEELVNTHGRAASPMVALLEMDGPLLRALYEAGWSRRGWRAAIGGLDGSLLDRAVLYDEITRADLAIPEIFGKLEVMLSAIAETAPELAKRFLGTMLRGESMICQGFSEPDAGSDIAAVRTSARLDAGRWVISGQKVWTSHGTVAKHCVLLARTGSASSRHRGLSLFWLDMETPGVTVRPIPATTRPDEFAEVFLDDVELPRDAIIGEVDGAWPIVMRMFEYERAMWAWQRQGELHRSLAELARTVPHDPEAEARLGEAASELAALRARAWSSVLKLASGEPLGPAASVDKSLLSQAEQRVFNLARDLLPGFAVGDGASDVAWRSEWFHSRASSVYGGAREVQRNVIAERVLGLPR